MGGLRRLLPATFWPFLAGAVCLAGLPPTGGFFSKDGILAAVWAKGGIFYEALYLVGTFTVFLTALYTFRMVLLVFGDRREDTLQGSLQSSQTPQTPGMKLPPLMEGMLLPLALLGLAGGLFNIPAYLGDGLLDSFLAPVNGAGGHLSPTTELALQAVAAVVSLSGLGLAWWYYGGKRRAVQLKRAEQPSTGIAAFLQAGWYVDALYRLLFVRPYQWLAKILWEQVDEGGIDDSLDRTAGQFGRLGQSLGRWGHGRVSVYMLSLACGATLMAGWFAWVIL
jgi:NADH-quinone oxidoreductase subunit L